MLAGSVRLSPQYVFEISALHGIRQWRDGLSLVMLDVTFDRQGDHTPRFNFLLAVLNWKLLEFGVYNIHHAEEKSSDE